MEQGWYKQKGKLSSCLVGCLQTKKSRWPWGYWYRKTQWCSSYIWSFWINCTIELMSLGWLWPRVNFIQMNTVHHMPDLLWALFGGKISWSSLRNSKPLHITTPIEVIQCFFGLISGLINPWRISSHNFILSPRNQSVLWGFS